MEALLTCNQVSVRYGESPALRDVSFSLCPGEILAVLGESGSGKSTLLRAILGLLEGSGAVAQGDILFEGRSLPDLQESRLRQVRGARIGMVFQDAGAALCPVRTVGSQFRETLSAHRRTTRAEALERGLTLFEKLGLQEGRRIWDSRPFQLSGGMKQRVGIARALALTPPLLLADEPTSALDTAVQRQVVLELLRARELFGTATILVTHDISLAAAMADQVLVLQEGLVREYGPAERILTVPESDYTRELLAAAPRLRRT